MQNIAQNPHNTIQCNTIQCNTRQDNANTPRSPNPREKKNNANKHPTPPDSPSSCSFLPSSVHTPLSALHPYPKESARVYRKQTCRVTKRTTKKTPEALTTDAFPTKTHEVEEHVPPPPSFPPSHSGSKLPSPTPCNCFIPSCTGLPPHRQHNSTPLPCDVGPENLPVIDRGACGQRPHAFVSLLPRLQGRGGRRGP